MKIFLPGQKYLDRTVLGGTEDVDHHTGPVLGWVTYELYTAFGAEPDGRWRATFSFDAVGDALSDVFEVRETPRAAFEALIQRLTIVNKDAMDEPPIKEIVQQMRISLDNAGHPEARP